MSPLIRPCVHFWLVSHKELSSSDTKQIQGEFHVVPSLAFHTFSHSFGQSSGTITGMHICTLCSMICICSYIRDLIYVHTHIPPTGMPVVCGEARRHPLVFGSIHIFDMNPVLRDLAAILLLSSSHVKGLFVMDPNVSKSSCTARHGGTARTSRCLSSVANDQCSEYHHRGEASGQANQRNHRQVNREDRIVVLEELGTDRTSSQNLEYQSLLVQQGNFEEQYDATAFDDLHVAFKLQHNEAFGSLARYCCDGMTPMNSPKVFFLDGPDGATTASLLESGIRVEDCYVANRHSSTCKTLESNYPNLNVLHTSAAKAFDDSTKNSFARVDFSAYYFDGCGGHVPHVVEMITAALTITAPWKKESNRIAVGFSLLGDTRNMVEKDLAITRAVAQLARARRMRTRQILDEPERYGIPATIPKTQGKTLTSWILLESDGTAGDSQC